MSKIGRYFRLSEECVRQLKWLRLQNGVSQASILEDLVAKQYEKERLNERARRISGQDKPELIDPYDFHL